MKNQIDKHCLMTRIDVLEPQAQRLHIGHGSPVVYSIDELKSRRVDPRM
jgi:hypothetical protein